MNIKVIITVLLTLAAGFILGGLGPRHNLLQLRRETGDLRRQLQQMRRRTPLDTLASSVLTRQPATGDRAKAARLSGDASQKADTANAPRQPRQPRRPAPLDEVINAQTELWQARTEQRRLELLEKTGLNNAESEMFDLLMEQVNLELAAQVAVWTEYIQAHKFINEEMRLRMMHDFTRVVVEGYDDLYLIMPEGWRNDAGSPNEFEIRDFIDPRVFLPMTNIADQIRPWPISTR